jgi:hypothetical protein
MLALRTRQMGDEALAVIAKHLPRCARHRKDSSGPAPFAAGQRRSASAASRVTVTVWPEQQDPSPKYPRAFPRALSTKPLHHHNARSCR